VAVIFWFIDALHLGVRMTTTLETGSAASRLHSMKSKLQCANKKCKECAAPRLHLGVLVTGLRRPAIAVCLLARHCFCLPA